MRRIFSILLLAIFFGGSTVIWATPVSAAQHLNGAVHVHWNMPAPGNDYYNVDQTMWIDRKATKTFWAIQWPLTGTNDQGYMGLQTSARRPDGSTGEMAIFSLWNANAARGDNGTCAKFGKEGDGFSCRMNFTIRTGTHYRFRIWRQEADSGGQWWGAYIRSSYSDFDYHLGDIRVASRTVGIPVNFTEYWGDAVPCDKVPRSIVNWTQPAANSRGDSTGSYQYYSSFRYYNMLNCITARVSQVNWGWTKGVKVDAGGL
jgi:hypothetical protein